MLHSIIGWDCILGAWSRVEGYPCDPNPNDPLANVSSESLFNEEGRLNPSITILGGFLILLVYVTIIFLLQRKRTCAQIQTEIQAVTCYTPLYNASWVS